MPGEDSFTAHGQQARIEPRKSLSATAYRLYYVTHVIQSEVDEIESAITEEDPGHPNIQLMAKMLQELTQAQERIYATIHKLPPLDQSRTPPNDLLD